MLRPGLVKIAALLSLILQVWGGTGLDRTCFCTRPGDESVSAPALQSTCKCCDKEPRPVAPINVGADEPDGCCIKAPLPDDSFPSQVRDHDQDVPRFVPCCAVALHVDIATPSSAVIGCPPRACSPPGAVHLASTRLRL